MYGRPYVIFQAVPWRNMATTTAATTVPRPIYDRAQEREGGYQIFVTVSHTQQLEEGGGERANETPLMIEPLKNQGQ